MPGTRTLIVAALAGAGVALFFAGFAAGLGLIVAAYLIDKEAE